MSQPDSVTTFGGLEEPEDAGPPLHSVKLSAWSMSRAKRAFDLSLVCVFTPLVCPLLVIIGLIVRLSSPGPAIFRQMRVGSLGRPFTILKFRTMDETASASVPGIAWMSTDRITPIGHFLRRLKLDELPQIINVLRGDMSLVGPRPRIPGQQLGSFPCRPGITGPATLVFAREEILLAEIPPHLVTQYYRKNIMPAKERLDSEYLSRASLRSDLQILLRTASVFWETPCAGRLAKHRAVNSGPQFAELQRDHGPIWLDITTFPSASTFTVDRTASNRPRSATET
jgi:lipopolysaccharide/colanic/teichoic acid biosynthesis glycosyltransferase